MAVYDLSKPHPHFEEDPVYPYMHSERARGGCGGGGRGAWGVRALGACACEGCSARPGLTPLPPTRHPTVRNKDFPWGPDGLFERKHH